MRKRSGPRTDVWSLEVGDMRGISKGNRIARGLINGDRRESICLSFGSDAIQV